MPKDPHLASVRLTHNLRVSGWTWKKIASHMGVSIPTARARVAEYHQRRKDRTLFSDIESMEEADLYAHPAAAPQNRERA